jgi:hypothetical protein
MLDDYSELLTDVMAVTGRIPPFELTFLKLLFRIGSSEPVEIESDSGCSDQECRIPSFSPMCATGIEDAGYDGCELGLITFTEKSIDSVDGYNIRNSHEPA